MTIHYLNCFTCNARIPRHWQSGTLCLLVESNDGLVLVDTGLGTRDYVDEPGILWTFKLVTIVPLNPEEAAIRQIVGLGHRPEDVRHIVLTHMHFDHAGGLPDFPWAKVHVHRREHEAIQSGKIRRWRTAVTTGVSSTTVRISFFMKGRGKNGMTSTRSACRSNLRCGCSRYLDIRQAIAGWPLRTAKDGCSTREMRPRLPKTPLSGWSDMFWVPTNRVCGNLQRPIQKFA